MPAVVEIIEAANGSGESFKIQTELEFDDRQFATFYIAALAKTTVGARCHLRNRFGNGIVTRNVHLFARHLVALASIEMPYPEGSIHTDCPPHRWECELEHSDEMELAD